MMGYSSRKTRSKAVMDSEDKETAAEEYQY